MSSAEKFTESAKYYGYRVIITYHWNGLFQLHLQKV